ncbi:hypothetical protein C8Q77DRAFT_869361 [Trametes polyzona]|nr:hypothetical protein C8Q77DRAFT_869361 [Trametes polyzona]
MTVACINDKYLERGRCLFFRPQDVVWTTRGQCTSLRRSQRLEGLSFRGIMSLSTLWVLSHRTATTGVLDSESAITLEVLQGPCGGEYYVSRVLEAPL